MMRGPNGPTDKPQPRPKGMATPCYTCPKIPPGATPVRANALCLDKKNADAFRHFRECKAVGQFPDDLTVRRNARIIQDTLDAVEREDRMTIIVKLGALGVKHAIH
jgi:hypothetical protein